MMIEKRVQKILQVTCHDESGNVLLFSVIVLMFLIFVISVVSLSVSNRVRMIRKEVDHNQVSAQAMQHAQNVENSIYQIINESDELSRYYMSRRYYNRDDTAFSQSSSNSSLDTYLTKLITPEFQNQIKIKMLDGSMNTNDCANALFVYLMVKRVETEPSLLPELNSVSTVITNHQNSELTIQSPQVNTRNEINSTHPSLDKILTAIGGQPFLDINYKLSVEPPASYERVDHIEYDISYTLSSYSYVLSGINVMKPDQEDLKKVLAAERYQLVTVINP